MPFSTGAKVVLGRRNLAGGPWTVSCVDLEANNAPARRKERN
jgi:hypothetical protein